MGGDATSGLRTLSPTPAGLGVRWTDRLPSPIQVMLVSAPPRLLINADWWHHAAGTERRQALDALRYGTDSERSKLYLWGRGPLRAAGLLRQALDSQPV